jgi:sugar/nucleoside kinase (ribokinase family)
MTKLYDIAAIGNAIVDVIAPADDAFLAAQGLAKGAMTLIDEARATALHAAMAKGVETSGGSAANTVAGVASLGGSAAFIGKVADDETGRVFEEDIQELGAKFGNAGPLIGGAATARCLINVTSDGQRTMATFLGAAGQLTPDDVEEDIIDDATIVYLEGYLFDPENARRAFAKAAALARTSETKIAFSLSDPFVVERHRAALKEFIASQVDILFANEAEICALFETADFEDAATLAGGIVEIAAITRGEKGSVIVANAERLHIEAYPVEKVVDTTGAGDQYAAGFLYGFANGYALPICGKLGSLAAAEVISHYGPRPQTRLADLAEKAGLIGETA